jgi:hypothetical protein
MRLYINGERVTSFSTETYPSLNQISVVNNSSYTMHISSIRGGADYFDGYMAEINHIDGQALPPTDFGEFDEDSGIWKPIQYTGTYGTNGFYLDFENSGSLGADQSGNGNNFTPTNLASTDQTTDTPTNNFATLNPLFKSTCTLSEGNLKTVGTSSNDNENSSVSTIAMPSGKWYCEVNVINAGGVPNLGILDLDSTQQGTDNHNNAFFYQSDGDKCSRINGVNNFNQAYGATYTAGDIISILYNADDGTITFFKNGTTQGEAFSGIDTSKSWVFFLSDNTGAGDNTFIANFGQDGSFAGTETAQGNTDSNGFGDFYYTPTSGYLALCTQNLATELSPTIDDGSQYFQPITYSGNGGNQDISANFDIDLAWIKSRTNAYNHVLIDTLRGNSNRLYSNATDAESTLASPNEINLDGSTLDLNGGVSIYNASGNNYITWLWNAGGTGVTNTDGSITSTVSANPTAGFSIVTYTGTGANATVGHGLGKALDMIIVKNRDRAESWRVGMTAIGFTKQLLLNATDAESTDSLVWQDTAPTSSVFSIGTRNAVNASGEDLVAYCFAEIEGYSKFGSYTGNITSGTDGAFVYTGFRPSWIMVKSSSNAGQEWVLFDSKRDSFNVATKWLYPNASTAENGTADQRDVDFLSNGFKFRNAGGPTSYSGRTYIYMAFAESPFVSSTGIPVTAR